MPYQNKIKNKTKKLTSLNTSSKLKSMRLLPRWSFSTKLTLVFLTVTLIPITVISIYYTESWEIVLITGLISIIASLLLGHNISQPISRLTKAATLIKKNHTYDPSDLKDISAGHDEIAHR